LRRKTFALWIVIALAVSAVDWVTPDASAPESPRAAHHLRAGYRNVDPQYWYPLLARATHALRAPRAPRGEPLFVEKNDGAALRATTRAATLTWVGHSTFLVQLDGVNVLTDPHWGDRTSPVSFAGPRRLLPPGIRFGDLPHIDAVVISHDHYDHLDAGTVDRLWRVHHPRFFVPLGLKAWLQARGIDDVTELDWWESAVHRGVTFVCTPAQHSSGRGVTDQNRRLWSSWVLAGERQRMFFAGDTGYYAGLAEIGRRLGPFGVAALPIGGYSDYRTRHPNHLNPEEAAQVFEEIGASLLVPMHWGTFDLNREPFREPPDRLLAAAVQRGIEDRVALLSPGETIPW
jgi:N-acyl-phosphatidylethanolamine-hydrolysing phospholipase D